MAAPHEVLRIPTLRGLTDYPERAPYGSAVLAENVEFSQGYLAPRQGCRILATLTASTQTVDLIHEVRAKSGATALVVVMSYFNAGLRWYQVSLCDCVTGTQLTYWSEPYYHPGTRQPTAVDYEGATLIFLPGMGMIDGQTEINVILEATPSELKPWQFTSVGRPLLGREAGTYYDYANGERLSATWGVVYQDRLFLGGFPDDDSGRLRYTAISDLHGVPKANEVVGLGTANDPLTGGAAYAGKLVIFRRHNISLLTMAGAGTEITEPLTQHVGCVAHQTICQFAHRLGFLSESGYMTMDQAGGIQELTEAIHDTLISQLPGFDRATVLYYPLRTQFWLLLPLLQTIYVYGLRDGNWSTFRFSDPAQVYSVGALGTVTMNNALYPLVGWVNATYWALVSIFERGTFEDQMAAATERSVVSKWQSCPIPLLGHHQVRLFRYLRLVLKDVHTTAYLRCYWIIEGQGANLDQPYPADQYEDILLINPRSTEPRLNTGTEVPPATPPEVDARVSWSLGAQWFAWRISPGGYHKGRWIQIGFQGWTYNDFGVRSLELDTRREFGRR